MSINIRTNAEVGILEITYSPEEVRPQDLAEQRQMVADRISRTGIRRVLLDASALVGFPSILTVLEHNAEIAAHKILRRAKFAVICSSLGVDERSLETTGVNRGVNIKCFTSKQDALSWVTQP